ncbi:hypothetical protein CUMW_047520 [Citrus unshiu]|nr:hypothetical protein CUMW_047520 [Citrus unshiu]
MYVPLCQLPKQKSVYFRSLTGAKQIRHGYCFSLLFTSNIHIQQCDIPTGFLVQSFFLYLRLCLWSYMIHNSLKEPLEHKGGLISHEIW